jgi:hypothetical protein
MSDVKQPDGWRQREHEQLQAWLKLSYRQRLDWLWQAKLFAERARLAVRREHRSEDASTEGKKRDPSGA